MYISIFFFRTGLGAPVGSVIVGSEKFITKAIRVRKALGGGMRQVGILAAAGLYGLTHNKNRMSTDHQNAKKVARGLIFFYILLDLQQISEVY